MAATETITLRLVAQDLMSGNVSKAISGLDKLAKQGGLVGSVAQGIGQSFGQMLNPMNVATKAFDLMATGAGKVAGALSGMAQAYREDQAEQAQFTNTLVRNIANWQDYTDEIDAAIAAGQRLAFTDTQQRQSLSRLITATRDARRAITLNRLAMDIARQRSIKLSEASSAVQKAAQGQYKGLRSLGYVIDATADSTQVLADVTQQAADAAVTWAGTDQGKLAARLIEISEKAEATGKSFQFIKDTQNDLALTTLDAGIYFATLTGAVADFLGVSKDAEGQTIAQAQSMENLGKRLQAIGYSYDRTAELIKKDFGGVAKTVDWATAHMNQSMSDFLQPWQQHWRDAADWAKDPFRPAKFERWLAKRAEKAIENAKQAAKDGKPGVEERWRAIARAMKSPVITAVGEIKTSIAEVIRAMEVIDGVNATLGNFRRNGSTGTGQLPQVLGPNGGDVGNNAGGTSSWRGGWTWVGENGRELMNLPQGTRIRSNSASEAMSAAPVNVYVTHIGALSEAEGDRLAAVIEKPLRRRMARSGA